jgi:hypothetical protein
MHGARPHHPPGSQWATLGGSAWAAVDRYGPRGRQDPRIPGRVSHVHEEERILRGGPATATCGVEWKPRGVARRRSPVSSPGDAGSACRRFDPRALDRAWVCRLLGAAGARAAHPASRRALLVGQLRIFECLHAASSRGERPMRRIADGCRVRPVQHRGSANACPRSSTLRRRHCRGQHELCFTEFC